MPLHWTCRWWAASSGKDGCCKYKSIHGVKITISSGASLHYERFLRSVWRTSLSILFRRAELCDFYRVPPLLAGGSVVPLPLCSVSRSSMFKKLVNSRTSGDTPWPLQAIAPLCFWIMYYRFRFFYLWSLCPPSMAVWLSFWRRDWRRKLQVVLAFCTSLRTVIF